ncbi:ribosome recycling factor [Candidatus Parcubacteria bacterium]|nr:ribosome recycling factor [Candidatus Parcubacteria bacterium]
MNPLLKDIFHQFNVSCEAALRYVTEQLAGLRTSRATPAMVENVVVEAYGEKMPLKAVASISVPEARIIVIAPWDPTVITAIEKALHSQVSALSPAIDQNTIKLTVPVLTEERRKELLKVLHQRLEEGRVRMRTSREEIWKKIQALEKEKKISEDEKFRGKDELQKIIDKYQQRLEQMGRNKETEIMKT